MSLTGKVILLTGASSGIGAETAVHLIKLGATLSITGRNKDNLNKVVEHCGHPRPFIVTGDLSNEKDVKYIIEMTIKRYGKLDCLINNAGMLEFGGIELTSLGQYDRIFNLNVRGLYHLTTLAVPHLIKTKGNIVNISSVAGLRAFPDFLAYCMSKAAVDQFTRCVALELGPKQVRVNAVNPGVIECTNLYGEMSPEQQASFIEKSKEANALKKMGDVKEVANAIAFLISDEASYITGVTLSVDGGKQAMCP